MFSKEEVANSMVRAPSSEQRSGNLRRLTSHKEYETRALSEADRTGISPAKYFATNVKNHSQRCTNFGLVGSLITDAYRDPIVAFRTHMMKAL
jgi:hypothetical protein